MRIGLSPFIIVCALVIAACQTIAPKIGTGPLSLSPNVSGSFENYKLHSSPTHFAVSNDGKNSGAMRCPPQYIECEVDDGTLALELCNKAAKLRGTSCSIFAVGKTVVWKGQVTYPNRSAEYTVLVSISDFEGSGNVATGSGTKNGQTIELRYSDCSGVADLNSQRWSIKGCNKNYSAEGTIEAGKGKVSYIGYGKDSKGNDAEIRILKTPDQATKNSPTLQQEKSASSDLKNKQNDPWERALDRVIEERNK
jgi:hypothetical protein